METASAFKERYTYDKRGNRQTLESDQNLNLTGGFDYVYDKGDRLTKVTHQGSPNVSYRYNGDNLMVERTENGQTTRYYYDGQNIVAEGLVQASGSVVEKVSYLRGHGLSMLEEADGTKGYYVHNGHGDVEAILGENGQTLNSYTYDIWGKPLTASETVVNSFRYSGEYWDEITDLQCLRARWYDPSIGRFINEDTYEGEVGNPLSQNLYTYVHNNPLINVDPTGNYCVSQDGKYAHAGTCNSSTSIYLGDDRNLVGRPEIWNSKVTGFLTKSGTSYNSVQYSSNYWTAYKEDYSYVRWVAGDNDYYYSLDTGTQQKLRQRHLANYMGEQIKAGFPDFIDGLMWGATLATLGRVKVPLILKSFDDIVANPTSLWGKTADEVADILGSGWTAGKYGSKGTGWKFTKGDMSVFYHPGGGVHKGSYYGFSSGKLGKNKIVDSNYIPIQGDKANIFHIGK